MVLLLCGFNRINSDRSIPTTAVQAEIVATTQKFQSYQFRQINPDGKNSLDEVPSEYSFNRINSDRSIPTMQNRVFSGDELTGFNRINSDRSIPT